MKLTELDSVNITTENTAKGKQGQKGRILLLWSATFMKNYRLPQRDHVLVVALMVGSFALYLMHLNTFQIGTYIDDAHYITMARALATGRGFSLINYPTPQPEVTYPPGYSVLLAPIAFFFPQSLTAFTIPSVLFTLASLPLWYRVLRRHMPFPLDILTLTAAATNPFIAEDATLVMSEAAFLFLTSILFVLAEAYFDKKPYPQIKSVAMALTLIALYFVRNIGIIFLVVTLAYLLYRRRVRHALIIASLFVIAAGVWSLYGAPQGQGIVPTQYATTMVQTPKNSGTGLGPQGLIRRVIVNAETYATVSIPHVLLFDTSGPWEAKTTKTLIAATHTGWLGDIIPLATTIIVVLGLVRALLIRIQFSSLASLFYGTALLLWAWPQARYLHPLVPLIYVFLILGIDLGLRHLLLAKLSRARSQQLLTVLLGGVVLYNVALDVHSIREPIRNRITDISVGTTWIARTSPPSSIVMGEYPVAQSLYAERHMVNFPMAAAIRDGQYRDEIASEGVSYVLISPPITSPPQSTLDDVALALRSELRLHPDDYSLIYRNSTGNVEVFQVRGQ